MPAACAAVFAQTWLRWSAIESNAASVAVVLTAFVVRIVAAEGVVASLPSDGSMACDGPLAAPSESGPIAAMVLGGQQGACARKVAPAK